MESSGALVVFPPLAPSAQTFAFPPALEPGDLVAVVAPSSPFPHDEFWSGLGWLRDRYRLWMSDRIFARHGFLAGHDPRRADELGRAMRDPEVKAIVAARGGYGALRIVDALPWDALVAAPKWLVGFSDITALAAELWKRGVASIHGPNVTGLGLARASPWLRARWLASLERPRAGSTWTSLRVVRAGEAAGPIVGGNLALVEAMAAAGRLVVPLGAILALEDVTERPYRIDRMLTSLRLGGHLARASGIVFGELLRCEPGADGHTAEEVVDAATRDLGIPVYAGAPFGHGAVNEAFVLGASATMRDARVTIG